MKNSDMTAQNDNIAFSDLVRPHPDRAFADRAVTLTIEGLFDREVSHYHVAKALFDMAVSIAPGDGTGEKDTEDWYHLLEYFHEQVKIHRQMLKDALFDQES